MKQTRLEQLLDQLEKLNKKIESTKTLEELVGLQLAGEMLLKNIEREKYDNS